MAKIFPSKINEVTKKIVEEYKPDRIGDFFIQDILSKGKVFYAK